MCDLVSLNFFSVLLVTRIGGNLFLLFFFYLPRISWLVVLFFLFLFLLDPLPDLLFFFVVFRFVQCIQHAGIGHAMVNKLHYLVDISLIV